MSTITASPPDYAALLGNVSRAGVYHLPFALHDKFEGLMAAAKDLDYAVFRVDLSEARNKQDLLATIGKTMDFPDWFGDNWDALADCLADLRQKNELVIIEGAGSPAEINLKARDIVTELLIKFDERIAPHDGWVEAICVGGRTASGGEAQGEGSQPRSPGPSTQTPWCTACDRTTPRCLGYAAAERTF